MFMCKADIITIVFILLIQGDKNNEYTHQLGVISMKIMALFDEHRKKIKFE